MRLRTLNQSLVAIQSLTSGSNVNLSNKQPTSARNGLHLSTHSTNQPQVLSMLEVDSATYFTVLERAASRKFITSLIKVMQDLLATYTNMLSHVGGSHQSRL